MRSLQSFLQSPRDQRIDALKRVISILLQGMALHSFSYDGAEFELFQRAIRTLRDDIASVEDDDSVLIMAGSAIRTLQEHTEAAERTIAARQDELEAAIAMVSDSLLTVGHIGESLGVELKESERDVASAREPAEILAARGRLARCLEDIRVYVLRRNEASLLSPQAYLENELDPLTGLPDSRKAVDAISAAWGRRDEFKCAAFAVRRLDTINARYGFRAGDEVLRIMSDSLKAIFPDHRLLFRWRGPYILALVDKYSTESVVAPEMQRLVAARLQHMIALKDREVMLSISIAWKMIPLEAKSVEEMIHTLDELTTIRLRQEA